VAHHKISPSALPMLEKCIGFESDGETSPYAQQGTDEHKVLESLLNGEKVEQVPDSVKYAHDLILQFVGGFEEYLKPEVSIGIMSSTFTTIYGTVDVCMVNDDGDGMVIDYKSGQKRDYWAQLKAYGLGLAQAYDLNNVQTVVIYGRQHCYESDIFEAEDLQKDFDALIEKYLRKHEDKEARTPCEYCKWCLHKSNCKARTKAVKEVAPEDKKDLLKGIRADMNLKKIDGEKLGRLYQFSKVIADFADDVKKEVKERLENEQKVTGYELKKKAGKTSISDPVGLFHKSGIEPEKFIKLCSISPSKAKKLGVDYEEFTKKGKESVEIKEVEKNPKEKEN